MDKHLPDEQEIAALLEKQRSDRGRAKLYPEVSRELKDESIRSDIRRKTETLMDSPGKVDLSDLQAVKARAESYLRSCADSATIPSVMGLASLGFGISRQWLNEFCRTHKGSPSAEFIEQLKDLFADILSNAALNRAASEAMSIFILKNCNGFVDRVEVTPGTPENPLGPAQEQAALEAKLQDIVIDENFDEN